MRAPVLRTITTMAAAAALTPLTQPASVHAAPATSPATTSSQAALSGTTTIVVKAPRCKNCRVVAVSSPRLEGSQTFYVGDVVRSRTVIQVPSERTSGLIFTVVNPRAKGRITALPLVALQYKGMGVGTDVSPTRAAQARRAKVCWSGTSEKSVTLKLRTRRDSRLTSVGGYRYWLGETVQTRGPWKYASRGSVAIRDGYDVCE